MVGASCEQNSGLVGVKLAADPLFESRHADFAAQEGLDQVAGGSGASGFEDFAAVAEGGGAFDEVGGVELREEFEGHDLVVEVGVVVGGVAHQVGERRVHAVAVNELVAGEAVVAGAEEIVEV